MPFFRAKFKNIDESVSCVDPDRRESVLTSNMPIRYRIEIVRTVWKHFSGQYNQKASSAKILTFLCLFHVSVEVDNRVQEIGCNLRHAPSMPTIKQIVK